MPSDEATPPGLDPRVAQSIERSSGEHTATHIGTRIAEIARTRPQRRNRSLA